MLVFFQEIGRIQCDVEVCIFASGVESHGTKAKHLSLVKNIVMLVEAA